MAAYPTSAAVGSTAEPYRATKLWNAAIEAFCQGMPTGTRRFLLRQYDSSFTASEAVDWLHQYLRSSDDFGPSVTRHQTVQLLQKFLSAGIFTEVRGKGSSFHDNKNIYRFTESCRTVCSQAPLSARDTNTLPVESCPGGEKPAVMNKPLKAKAPAPPVDPQLELQAWNQAILKRLTELLGEDWVCRMIDRYCINSSHMKHTVTRRSRSGIVEPTDEKDDVPHWVLSAMKCLANWRTDSEEAEEWQSCYSGFELDVLKVISEYFQGLEQPLLHPVSASLINRLLGYTQGGLSSKEPLILHKDVQRKTRPNTVRRIKSFSMQPADKRQNFVKRYTSSPGLSRAASQDCLSSERSVSNNDVSPQGYSNMSRATSYTCLSAEKSLSNGDLSPQHPAVKVKLSMPRPRGRMFSIVGWSNPKLNQAVEPSGPRTGPGVSTRLAAGSSYSTGRAKTTTQGTDDEHVGVQMATTTEALQLCCLLSHPNDYRKLQLLVRFMTSVANNPSLTLHPSLPARTLMLKIFTWCIVRGSSHQQNQYAYDFGAMQMASYLLDHHKDILVAPPDFQQRVQKLVQRNRPGQRVTFCKQISCEEFENQKLSLSQHALAELLQSILHDSRMPNKVRQRKLKQFKEIYPDIYAEHVAQNKENPAAVQTQTTAKQGFPRIKKPLLKLNSLRF
ncbi:PREDICTED: DEP domain-containing protein 1B-like isoform X2 [Branchiostoma belcheri]|uniref:DEP domain-containing protein 1B-like isoform X2 n=1 Tax=Branchiostoma belcheri TaxID=7741 RepID=A0A6P4Y9N9_BRABE|nr:PREDICTED: DEP domain-containing protein 1B-like isoform X2 [Branchiostoma belcheri]